MSGLRVGANHRPVGPERNGRLCRYLGLESGMHAFLDLTSGETFFFYRCGPGYAFDPGPEVTLSEIMAARRESRP